jgi:S-methylmethionine-dependent homocysteine/selenocysteine methylase
MWDLALPRPFAPVNQHGLYVKRTYVVEIMRTHKYMNNVLDLQNRLQRNERILMDGAMGTEILRRGVPTTLPLWSADALLSHPEVVRNIHADYIAAGAEIVITDTFRTIARAFAQKDGFENAKAAKDGKYAEEAYAATILACRLAKEAIEQVKPEHPIYIAGSMAPLEDCYIPELTPPAVDLLTEHAVTAQSLKDGGVDFLLIETMITVRETMAAVQAAKQVHLPFAVSFCTNREGNLLSDETLEEVVREVEQYDPLFLGVNCVSPAIATHTLHILKQLTTKPLSVYAQGDGIPELEQGWTFVNEEYVEDYIAHVDQWIEAGAQIIGGCCGTSPIYIERLRTMVK